MMMYESTAVSPTGWKCPRDHPTILGGHGLCVLHHTGWGWGQSVCVWAQSEQRWVLLPGQLILSPISALNSCAQMLCVWADSLWYHPRAMLLSGRCWVQLLLPHWVWNVLPSSCSLLYLCLKNSSLHFQAQDFWGFTYIWLCFLWPGHDSCESWEWSHLPALFPKGSVSIPSSLVPNLNYCLVFFSLTIFSG